MSRWMRVIVFFDLPMTTTSDLRNYRNFRKALLKMGFMMMQESVYSKIVVTAGVGKSLTSKLRRFSPSNGLVQVLMVTEKQYSDMTLIVGEEKSSTIQSIERVVIL